MSDQPQLPIPWQINQLMHLAAPLPRLAAIDLGTAAEAQENARHRLIEKLRTDPEWRHAVVSLARDLVRQVVGFRGRSMSCLRDRAREVLWLMDVAEQSFGDPPPPDSPSFRANVEESARLADMDPDAPEWRGTLLRHCQGVVESAILGNEPDPASARAVVERLLDRSLRHNPPALRNGFRLPHDPPHTPVAPGNQEAPAQAESQ